ncbi:MAG: hypothetical protein ACE5GJ_13670 [Gemmatimonadota bacterium]
MARRPFLTFLFLVVIPATMAAGAALGAARSAFLGLQAQGAAYAQRLTTQAPPALPPFPSRAAVILVGLLLLFMVLVGWIQLARPAVRGDARSAVAAAVLPSLVPVALILALAFHLRSEFSDRAHREAVAEMNRGLMALGNADSTQATSFHDRAGDHVTLLAGGGVFFTTHPRPPEGLRTIPLPPGSFTSMGTLRSPPDSLLFVARRVNGDGAVVLTRPVPTQRAAALAAELNWIAGLYLGWMALLAVGAGRLLLSRTGS